MQAQAQLSGQCIALSDKGTLASNPWGGNRTWQTDADLALRRKVVEKIAQTFQKCKHQLPLEWQQKIPDLVSNVEQALYNDAASKEEYADLRTLEQRLQHVTPRFVNQQQQQQRATSLEDLARSSASAASVSSINMVPTPGMNGNLVPAPGYTNTMIPVPGHGNGTVRTSSMMPTPGLGNKMPNGMMPTGNANMSFVASSVQTSAGMFQNGNLMPVNGMRMMHDGQLASSAGFSAGGMQMMPTPGLSMPQQIPQQMPGLGNFAKAGDISMQQQQQLGSSNGHLLRAHQMKTANGLANGMVMNRNHLANGNIGVHDFSNQQAQFMLQQQQQRLNQQQRLQTLSSPMPSGSYAMNAADLAGSGANIYTPSTTGGLMNNGVALNAINPQLAKVPNQAVALSLQQQRLQQQQQQHHKQLHQQMQQQLQQQRQQQGNQLQQPQQQEQQSTTFQQLSDLTKASIDIPTVVSSAPVVPIQIDQQQQMPEQKPSPQQIQQTWQPDTRSNIAIENQTIVADQHKQFQPAQTEMVQPKSEPMTVDTDHQQQRSPEPAPAVLLKQESPSSMVSTPGAVAAQPDSNGSGTGPQSGISSTRAQQYLKQQRWLLFLRHATKCSAAAGGQCLCSPHCQTARQLLSHMSKCRDRECQYARCSASMKLLTHHQSCRNATCPVCGPVRRAILRQTHPPPAASPPGSKDAGGGGQPPLKRAKISSPESENGDGFVKPEPKEIGIKAPRTDHGGGGFRNPKPEPGSNDVKHHHPGNAIVKHDSGSARIGKGGKPKIVGVSLTEIFTTDQIRQHIMSLRQWVGQSKSKVEKIQAMEHQANEHACRLCAVEKLFFDPPPIYCTSCGIRVKRNAFYCTTAIRETRHYFCIPCYNEVRTENVELEGLTYAKSSLEKRKHDEEQEEAWVCCDKCNLWQHQTCALFNSRRNEGGEAEYTCPECCMAEMESGERLPLLVSAVLGAKDLPRTYLSDHLESKLAQRLKQERAERAKKEGRSYDEVPGAEGLVVRVVSSVDKRLEVKPRFLEIFQEEDYPTEFPYKSKALLLFQSIEGVEVCLFGMYVQEFGVESAQPNQRRVYLSYLDSVKYFRPAEVKTQNGEALRTFVYHELLIAYLDYCKRRGFSSCYIWACPPLKGEDYILYCHPEIQKTPKSDKLREWYLTMLRKASRENIVVEVTNFYDFFFISPGECKAKVTAARLPYFDGDYWPGAAEDMIVQLQQQDDDDGSKQQKKGKIKKPPTKRATKTAAQAEMAINASKDDQLMQKLGESIMPMKEDFIMVHLHYTCTHCRNFILSGCRWVCRICKSFQLCDRCHENELKLDERERHPANTKEMHYLAPIEIEAPGDTKDSDDLMESEFFDTRHAFLTLCQGNHYQYDTLRRAKHSSMMVLYHLHNPMAPAFVVTCCICSHDIEPGQGWKCETCTEFDVCNGCYHKDETKKHPHKLVPHPSASERNAQNKEARQQRVQQLKMMQELLVHASQCCTTVQCQYPNCGHLKRLFRHGMTCQKRIIGNCLQCKKMWSFMQLHARSCKQPHCRVPRCKDLREHLRRYQLQMESRRRAAVNEMMRQRTAETAGRKQ